MKLSYILLVLFVCLPFVYAENDSPKDLNDPPKNDLPKDLNQNEKPVNEITRMARKLRICISKLVCELAAKPLRHGNSGLKLVAKVATKLRWPFSGPFYTAYKFGSRSDSPDRCMEEYSECSTPSSDLVHIGNQVINEDHS